MKKLEIHRINLYKEILKMIRVECADNDISGIELELVQMETLAEVISEHLEDLLEKIEASRNENLIEFIEEKNQVIFR
jgi:hypothetical protein